MILIPAMDILNNKLVRLFQGNYEQSTVYENNPLEQAKTFYDLGFTRLHIVDLTAAKLGYSKELAWVERIKKYCDIQIDYGGGIRNAEQLQSVFSAGADFANISSLAVTDPIQMDSLIQRFGADRFVLCPDSKNGRIQTHAWTSASQMTVFQFIENYSHFNDLEFLCTDVNQDGTLNGLNTRLYQEILDSFPSIKLIASGGLSREEELDDCERQGCYAVILGKAWYDKKLTIQHVKRYLRVR